MPGCSSSRACSTPEEMLALARVEGYELTDKELEGVSGGWSGPCGDNEFMTDM